MLLNTGVRKTSENIVDNQENTPMDHQTNQATIFTRDINDSNYSISDLLCNYLSLYRILKKEVEIL